MVYIWLIQFYSIIKTCSHYSYFFAFPMRCLENGHHKHFTDIFLLS